MLLTGKTQAEYDLEILKALEKEARNKIKELIDKSNWTQLEDSFEDAPNEKKAWKQYRKLLRSVEKQPKFPEVIDWPVPPSNLEY